MLRALEMFPSDTCCRVCTPVQLSSQHQSSTLCGCGAGAQGYATTGKLDGAWPPPVWPLPGPGRVNGPEAVPPAPREAAWWSACAASSMPYNGAGALAQAGAIGGGRAPWAGNGKEDLVPDPAVVATAGLTAAAALGELGWLRTWEEEKRPAAEIAAAIRQPPPSIPPPPPPQWTGCALLGADLRDPLGAILCVDPIGQPTKVQLLKEESEWTHLLSNALIEELLLEE